LFAPRFRTLVAFVVAVAMVGSSALAQSTPDPSFLLTAFFGNGPVDGSVFAPSFLAQAPIAKVKAAIEDYKARLGGLSTVAKAGAGTDYLMTFQRGTLLATMQLNWGGKISGLLFHDEVSPANSAALQRFFSANSASPDWFAPSFLAKVPMTRITAVMTQVTSEEGAFKRIDTREGSYFAVFEKSQNHVNVSTDATGRFTALLLRPAEPLSAAAS
jgi:hypothetical protein